MVGNDDGCDVGNSVGFDDGLPVGWSVLVGRMVGTIAENGCAEGDIVGTITGIGCTVGLGKV